DPSDPFDVPGDRARVDEEDRVAGLDAGGEAHLGRRRLLRPSDAHALDVEQGRMGDGPRRRRQRREHDDPDHPPEATSTLGPQRCDAPFPDARVDRLRRRAGRSRGPRTHLRRHGDPASSPTTCSSGTSSTPVDSATRRWTSATRSMTSRAVAPASAWKKLACFSDTTAPPTRSPLSPAASMRRPALSPGAVAGRVAEHRARVLAPRLVFAPPAHDLGDAGLAGLGLAGRHLELGRGDDLAGAEVRVAVAEIEVLGLPGPRRGLSGAVQEIDDPGPGQDLDGLAAVPPPGHAHRAPPPTPGLPPDT